MFKICQKRYIAKKKKIIQSFIHSKNINNRKFYRLMTMGWKKLDLTGQNTWKNFSIQIQKNSKQIEKFLPLKSNDIHNRLNRFSWKSCPRYNLLTRRIRICQFLIIYGMILTYLHLDLLIKYDLKKLNSINQFSFDDVRWILY